MSFRKTLASLAVVALISSAALSVPAIAQDSDHDGDDASLWLATAGIATATVLGIVWGTSHHKNRPVSP